MHVIGRRIRDFKELGSHFGFGHVKQLSIDLFKRYKFHVTEIMAK
jgi:hypothetical protein